MFGRDPPIWIEYKLRLNSYLVTWFLFVLARYT